MTIFKWYKALETGIPMIDKQHAEILERANTFFICLKNGSTEAPALACLNFLQQYVQYHFQAEEAFQVNSAYPRYAEHCAKHQALTAQVKFFSIRLMDAHFSREIVEEFNLFLRSWISEHILMDDCIFAEYYKQQNMLPNTTTEPTNP